MKIVEVDELDLKIHIGSQDLQDYFIDRDEKWLVKHCNRILRGFFRRRLLEELVTLYGCEKRLYGCCLLYTHGWTTRAGRWCFDDYGKQGKIQDWITQRDGEATALLLYCCNPRNVEIFSQKSIVVHANRAFFRPEPLIGKGKSLMRFFYPGEGYLEQNYYRLRRILEKLRLKITAS